MRRMSATLLVIVLSGCWADEPVDPLVCYENRPEDCERLVSDVGCHLAPVQMALVYDPLRACHERHSVVCAPAEQETFLGSYGLGEQSEVAVSPDGRCFSSATIGNFWRSYEAEAPDVNCMYDSETPWCDELE